jgi:hypothetical protein
VSADARVARAIIEVRVQLDKQSVPQDLHDAVHDLIDEAMHGLHLTNDDIEWYRYQT